MTSIRLKVLGLSNSQSQSGAYALILAEENGDRRLPIIIGSFEAQSIALQLENLEPPRPLTHDLFRNFAKAFGIIIQKVVIDNLAEGVFYSTMVCSQGESVFEVDARTSDAVALALRFNAPIFTTPSILERAGIVLDLSKEEEEDNEKEIKDIDNEPLRAASLAGLNDMLRAAVENEDYELASKIRDEINNRQAS